MAVCAFRGNFLLSRLTYLSSNALKWRPSTQLSRSLCSSAVLRERRFTQSHEWIQVQGEVGTVGITDHAQELLGDIVFVDLPAVGDSVTQGDSCSLVESVKAASDIYAPASGEVLEVNPELEKQPELVNKSPFDDGWLFKIKLEDSEAWKELLTEDQYRAGLDKE